MSLFRTKSMSDLMPAEDEHGLKRVLTGTNLVLLGIGAIIGAGSSLLYEQHGPPGYIVFSADLFNVMK